MYLLAVLFWGLVNGLVIFQTTSVPHYYQLSWAEFKNLPAVRKNIPLNQPDYDLLDAAIFQVTNKVRVQENKLPLQFSSLLYRSAVFHAQAMIDLDFYAHYNYKQVHYLTPYKRILAFGGLFHYTAENIAQYDIINTDLEYCPAKQPNGNFRYLNCKTLQPYQAFTYLAYAEAVVNGWLHSPPHRVNLLSSNYQYMGCAARISKNPYRQRQVPFARLAQNFGGYGPDNNDTVPPKANTSSH